MSLLVNKVSGRAGTRSPESWSGEHRWRDFSASRAARRQGHQPGLDEVGGATKPLRPILHDELAQHRKVGDGWVAVRGLVFDVSDFLSHHPGGVRTLLGVLGSDATDQFNAVHPHVDVEAVMSIGCFVQGRLALEQPRSAVQSPREESDE